MRKLILAAALLLASASAHAGDSGGLVLAANNTAATTEIARPLPPISKSTTAKTQSAALARPQAFRTDRPVQSQRFRAGEAKARRIAAKYGIRW